METLEPSSREKYEKYTVFFSLSVRDSHKIRFQTYTFTKHTLIKVVGGSELNWNCPRREILSYQTLYVNLRNVHRTDWNRKTFLNTGIGRSPLSYNPTLDVNVLDDELSGIAKKGGRYPFSCYPALHAIFRNVLCHVWAFRSYNTLIHLRSKSFVK